MSENHGSLFAEARREKGLSLDEIAEAIHIKAEYLETIENEKFDFNLPDIYRRGFYKSYGDFLGLDMDEMMAKCPIKPFETLESSRKRREMVLQVAKKTQEADLDKVKTSFSDDVDEVTTSHEEPKSFSMNKAKAMKVAGIIGGTILLVLLLLYMIVGIVSRPDLPSVKVTKLENIGEFVEKKITMRAREDVKVIVRSEEDKAKLFSGTVQKGSEQVITYKTPIQIFFDRGEFLVVELANGEFLHPDSGRGGVQIK
ncbi:MAG: helix-turn-helix domain-containing protein [Puniceicoccales bacterium]|jgi:transcriptional regulator with XRE-family HTH domain|nr:helix-turn-helix domain-containing protein [Puniceicoccales bacterium]